MLWGQALRDVLVKLGFKQAKSDPCLFHKITKHCYTLVGVIVDDLVIASKTRAEANDLIRKIGKVYKVKNLGKPEYVIGIHIDHDEEKQVLQLNQKLYITNMGVLFGQSNAKQTTMPAAATTKLRKDMGSPPCTKDYRALIGSLLYVVITRPDVATIISQLSRYLQAPQQAHYNTALRVLRYLISTKENPLVYKDEGFAKGKELVVDSGSTWNSNPDNSRSRSGYAVTFNGCLISWKSTLQNLVTLSSCETEYVALNLAAKEGLWLRYLLAELQYPQTTTLIHVDNQSTIALSRHSMAKPRTKHIAMRWHWIREQVAAGNFYVEYIPTADNLADFLTKVLSMLNTWHLLKRYMAGARDE